VPSKPVISIVDDDESAREGTMDLIQAMGFFAEAFERAEDFLKSNRLHSTSCLIADVRMPGMTGLELHNRLVGSGNIIPTILITAFPDDRDRARALQAGVICYLSKPFKDDDLLACVRSALKSREAGGRES
jgi:FixJ family two-component response regulator